MVRILATGGRTARQAADDLGVGFSTLSNWKSRLEEAELMAGPHDDVMKELARLRRENELLRAKCADRWFVSLARPDSDCISPFDEAAGAKALAVE